MIVTVGIVMQSSILILSLIWSLVEVHSQTAPYVSFMGQNLANHSYVDLTLVEDDDSDGSYNTVRCNTDLETCCTGDQGIHRGNFYFPDGGVVQSHGGFGSPSIFRTHGDQRLTLYRRNNAMEPSGIYRCEVATVGVHNDGDDSLRAVVYVGLYTSGEGD